jgi:carbamate kinase
VRIVAALGGNALLRRDENPDSRIELSHVQEAARALAPLALAHELIICHGNGPQVGLLALESAADATLTRPYPLDALGAQTQGMIGYWLAQSLSNAGVVKPVVSLISQVLVDAADPAFAAPSKFVGAEYPQAQAQELAERQGWTIARDGDGWRRVVASPAPQRIVEQHTIGLLLRAGTIVICGGGGGVPVTEDDAAQLTGVEAVVDKDLTSALLAIAVDADRLLVLTDVPGVQQHFGTPAATTIPHLDVDALTHLQFPAGSMGPKIEACRRFAVATGRPAGIGRLEDATAVICGTAGTAVTASPPRPAPDLVGGPVPSGGRRLTERRVAQ